MADTTRVTQILIGITIGASIAYLVTGALVGPHFAAATCTDNYGDDATPIWNNQTVVDQWGELAVPQVEACRLPNGEVVEPKPMNLSNAEA